MNLKKNKAINESYDPRFGKTKPSDSIFRDVARKINNTSNQNINKDNITIKIEDLKEETINITAYAHSLTMPVDFAYSLFKALGCKDMCKEIEVLYADDYVFTNFSKNK